MWLCDLEKAIQDIRAICPDYVFTKVVPAGSGIVFYTTHFTRVLWIRDIFIIERDEENNLKILKDFRETP